MKRICSIILMLCMAFSMAACNSKVPDPIIPPTIPTADPTEPTAAPTEPTVAPTEPTEPTEPAEPTESTEPTEPTESTEPAEPVDISKVLEVDLGLMEWPKFNHKNQISEKTEYYISNDVEKEKVYNLGGVNYDLTYKQSALFAMGDRVCHQYIVNGEEESTIVLDDKGNLVQILFAYTKLNISPKATPEEVLEPLKKELAKILDLSYYNEIVPPTPSYRDDGTFWTYNYKFMHIVDGYVPEYFIISVHNDGIVQGLKIGKFATVDFKLNIDEEKAEATIVAKLKEIYNTETTQYLSYTPASYPTIVQYKGQLYARYRVTVTFSYTEYGGGQSSGYEASIMIPLEELSK